MFLLNVCLCAGVVLSFPQFAHQSCTEGTPKQCMEAEAAPGTNLAGEGFDITTMARKGAFVIDMSRWQRKDKKCTLCVNPYLEMKRQKLPLSVVHWRPTHSCSMKVSSQLHRSSEDLLSSSISSVENDWKVGLEVNAKNKASIMMAGTNSKLANYAMDKTKNDKYSFTSQAMSCEYYRYRISNTPRVHREFNKAVKKLPKTYDHSSKQQYYKLIDNFGTHYITQVKLGGSIQTVTSVKQCQASLQGLSVEEVQMCLEVEASATIHVITVESQVKHCKKDMEKSESKSSFSSLFRDRFVDIKGGSTTEPDLLFSADVSPSAYKDWLNTLPQNPDIVSYSLDPLHQLVSPKSPWYANLRSAISHYILEKALMRNCSESCQTGIKGSRDPCVCQCHNTPAVTPDCCPVRKGMARVMITVQKAENLWGDHGSATDGYVKVLFNDKIVQQSHVINNNNNPKWNTIVDLHAQDLSSGQKVRFEVWDEDSGWDNDLLGVCEQIVAPGVKSDVCALQHGRLFFKLEITCAPSLAGDSCMQYMPSPMRSSLKKLYVSRHSHPIPRDVLLDMGVFVDRPPKNQSLT